MKTKLMLITFMLTMILAGCSDDNSTDPQTSGNGSLKLYLVDNPAEYDSVIISVVGVEVHMSNADSLSGWHTINSDHRYFDLLLLMNGANAILGDTTLAPGNYQQIRLILDNGGYLIDSSGTRHNLDVPSGQQTGIKLNHNFTIEPGKLYELMLDFNVHKSIIKTGNGQYKLQPVIRVIPVEASGSIGGIVQPPDANAMVLTGIGADSVFTYPAAGGAFLLQGIPAGVYDVEIEPGNPVYRDTVITGITVVEGQQTDIGTVTLNSN